MNEAVVKLWLVKADNDLKTGKDELVSKKPATDTVCFHMQQCVEALWILAFVAISAKQVAAGSFISGDIAAGSLLYRQEGAP